MAEACIAAVWGSPSPLEAAKRAITAKKEPSRGYVTYYFNTFSKTLVTCQCSVLSLYFFFNLIYIMWAFGLLMIAQQTTSKN